jgi:enoyl-[acyl-carrier protein] reductase I
MRTLEPLPLAGRKGFVIGIANDQSIAWGCARAFRAAGADLALTYLNDKAPPHVAPLAERLGAGILLPCDVREPGRLEAVFEAIGERWAGSTSRSTRSPMRRARTCMVA